MKAALDFLSCYVGVFPIKLHGIPVCVNPWKCSTWL